MKETCWQDCIENEKTQRIKPDKAKAISLIETSDERINFMKESTIKKENANYIFENYYTSALEIMEAALYFKGLKILNHICVGFYIKEIMKNESLFRLFDDCRSKRNGLVYYGTKMDFETAKRSIININLLIKQFKQIYEQTINEFEKHK